MDQNTPQDNRYLIWLKQAKYDLAAAFLSLENEYFEWAAYQAEQAVEKALKAVIVQSGSKAPKIHKLGILFGFANRVNDKFKDTKFNFKHVESFTFISRYPLLLPDKAKTPHELISEKEAAKAITEASEVLLNITKILQSPFAEKAKASEALEEVKYSAEVIAKRLEQVKESLIKEFSPEKIILFGRFAREFGQAVAGTMDILVITECDNCSFIERIYRAREATGGDEPIVEPLVYTPSEIELLQGENESFLKSAFEEGKIIYARQSPK
jgi:HEPN domain-containing protein